MLNQGLHLVSLKYLVWNKEVHKKGSPYDNAVSESFNNVVKT